MQKNAVTFRGLRERRERGWSEEKTLFFLTHDQLCENPMNQSLGGAFYIPPILVSAPSFFIPSSGAISSYIVERLVGRGLRPPKLLTTEMLLKKRKKEYGGLDFAKKLYVTSYLKICLQ